MMSFWTFSDVFEEGGPIAQPFDGEFGLRAKGGINKPSYYDFALLHQLGSQRLANASKNVIVTRNADGSLSIVAWNLVDPDQHGTTRHMEISINGVAPHARATTQRVDDDHGNVLPKYAAMGKPLDPTPAQVAQLNQQTALPAAEETHLQRGKLQLDLTPNALLLIKIEP
jgi:xylan 1,4-beta-xylosidase